MYHLGMGKSELPKYPNGSNQIHYKVRAPRVDHPMIDRPERARILEIDLAILKLKPSELNKA